MLQVQRVDNHGWQVSAARVLARDIVFIVEVVSRRQSAREFVSNLCNSWPQNQLSPAATSKPESELPGRGGRMPFANHAGFDPKTKCWC